MRPRAWVGSLRVRAAAKRAAHVGLVGMCACAPVFRPTAPGETLAVRGAVRVDPEESKECLRLGGRYDLAPDVPTESPELASFLDEVPSEVRRVARGAGVESLLAELLRASARDDGPALEEKKLELVMRLSALEVQLTALLFEAGCMGDQMEAALRELERRQRTREIGLTVSSILVGAVAATAGGIWELRGSNGNQPAALMIGGGAASAALGLAAFIPERRAVVFPHERNLLTPIRDGEDPEGLYPSFVLRMLAMPSAGEDETLRDDILEDWDRILDEELAGEERARAEAVLYGDGGIYDERLMDVRERMFDVLESHVSAVDRDLELLYLYSTRLVKTQTHP